MALSDPNLNKSYQNRLVLTEAQLDAWRTDAESALATVNLNLTQLRRDLFLSTYTYDNDGNANLSQSLQDQINLLAGGGTPITGTTSDNFTVNTDGNGITFSTSGLTATQTLTFPDTGGVVTLIAATQSLSNKTVVAPVFSGTSSGTYTLGGTVTVASPIFSGTATGTYTLGGTPTITAPVLSGTVTGTYTMGGTVTVASPVFSGSSSGTYTLGGTVTVASPIFSGTATGTYTLGGTPTITAPTINGGTFDTGTITTSLTFTTSSAIFSTGEGTTFDGNDEAASSYKIKQVGTDLAFYAGSTSTARLLVNGAAATVSVVSGVDFITPAAQKWRPDGDVAGDTFATESAANIFDFHAGNAANYRLRLDGSAAQVKIGTGMDFTVEATQKAFFGASEISEPTAGTFRLTTGGVNMDIINGGLKPAVSPATPVADVFYRDAIPKAWGIIASSGTAADSFNVNTGSTVKNSTGNYSVVFTTAMATANYCVVVMPNKNAAVGTNAYITTTESMSTTGFTIQILTDDDAAVDSAYSFVVFGAQ